MQGCRPKSGRDVMLWKGGRAVDLAGRRKSTKAAGQAGLGLACILDCIEIC